MLKSESAPNPEEILGPQHFPVRPAASPQKGRWEDIAAVALRRAPAPNPLLLERHAELRLASSDYSHPLGITSRQ